MLIPVGTDRPRIRPAYLTIALIAVNVLVYLIGLGLPDETIAVQTSAGVVRVPLEATTYHLGLWSGHPTLLGCFTHMFAHAGLLHLAGNMLFLWVFGSLIEDAIGWRMLAALYVGGGIAAALSHLGMTQLMGAGRENVPMVGASGAVAAIMGLFLLRFYKTRVKIGWWLTLWLRGTFYAGAVWVLLYWIGMEVLDAVLDLGSRGGVAHWAHIGGFAVGAAVAPFLGAVRAAREEFFTDDPQTNVEYVRRSEVVASAERALAAEPGNPYLMLRLAEACQDAGLYERATTEFVRAARTFAARGLTSQAMETFSRLLDYNDAALLDAPTHLKLALELEKTGRRARAITAFALLAEGRPGVPEAEHALLRLAHLRFHHEHRPDEALRCLDRFLQRYPHSPLADQARRGRAQLKAQLERGLG
jgi:membrane associated rhomboid family serine protease